MNLNKTSKVILFPTVTIGIHGVKLTWALFVACVKIVTNIISTIQRKYFR